MIVDLLKALDTFKEESSTASKNRDKILSATETLRQYLTESYMAWSDFVKSNPLSVLSKLYKANPDSQPLYHTDNIAISAVSNFTHKQVKAKIQAYGKAEKQVDSLLGKLSVSINETEEEIQICNSLKELEKEEHKYYTTLGLYVPSTSDEGEDVEFVPIEELFDLCDNNLLTPMNTDLILKLEWTTLTSKFTKEVSQIDYHYIIHDVDNGNSLGFWHSDAIGAGNEDDFEPVSEFEFMEFQSESDFLLNICNLYINELVDS